MFPFPTERPVITYIMAIGVVAGDEFNKELERLSNGNHIQERVEIIEHGRGHKSEVPESIRKLIAAEAIAGASAKELASTFNVSESSVSAYKNGATSTASYHNKDASLAKANEDVKSDLSGRAQNKMREALDSIVFPSDIKPQIASAIARDMSSVIKNMNPEIATQINNQQVIVYKPRMKEEDDYEVLDVGNE